MALILGRTRLQSTGPALSQSISTVASRLAKSPKALPALHMLGEPARSEAIHLGSQENKGRGI